MPFYSWPTYIDLCVSVFAFILTLGLAKYVWNHRKIPGATYFIALCLTINLWTLFCFLETISYKLADKIFWENLQYSILYIVPILYLVFILLFTGQRKTLEKRIWPILLAQPVVNLVVIWTKLFPLGFRVNAVTINNGLDYPGILVSNYGHWFWFSSIYTFIFLLIDLVYLIIAYFKSPRWARNKLWFLILGLFIPWVISLLGVPGWMLFNHEYVLMLSVAASLTIITWGLLRARILDILPIARDAILDQVTDVVAVIDMDGRIVDFNQAAKLNPIIKPNICVGELFNQWMPELSSLQLDPHSMALQELEVTLTSGGMSGVFDLRLSPLLDEKQEAAGWLAIFRDISERKKEEKLIREAEGRAENSLRETQRQSQELNIVRTITEVLNRATTLRGALVPTFETIQEISGSTQLWICLINTDSTEDHREVFFTPKQKSSSLKFFDHVPNSATCLQDLLQNESSAARFYSNPAKEIFISGMNQIPFFSYPLRSGYSPLGALNIGLDSKGSISPNANHLIETICASLSVTIDRVRLLKSEYSERRISEAFREINSNLSASLNLNDVLDLLLEQVSRLIPIDAGCVMFVDKENAWITRKRGYEFLGEKTNDLISKTKFSLAATANLQQVVTTKKPVCVRDTHVAPSWQPVAGTQVFHSWLGAPVIIDHKVAMIFSLDKKESNFYQPRHADQLVTFCSGVSLAIQNARHFETGQKRIKELESLQATLTDISSQLDVNQLLKDIMRRALSLLDSTSGVLGLYQEKTNNYKIAINISEGEDLSGKIVNYDDGLMGMVGSSKTPLTLDDYSTWDKHLEDYISAFPHAVLEVPMLAGEKLVGVLAIGDANPQRKYNDDDIRLLSLFAQQATIALTNARLFTDAEQRAEEAETLRQASAIVASTLKQKKALRLILEQLSLVVPSDSASILLFNGKELELVEGRGFNGQTSPLGLRIALNQNQPGAIVFKQKRPLVINNMSLEYPSFLKIANSPILSWIGVPLTFKNRTIGILSLDSLQVNRYNNDHAQLASAFADQVAVALENVRLYENALQAAKRFAALNTMSQNISLNLQPQEVYEAIYRATVALMPADSFTLSLYDEKNKFINDVYIMENNVLQQGNQHPLGKDLPSQAITQDRAIMFNSLDERELKKAKSTFSGDDWVKEVAQSTIFVPLRIGKKPKGVLIIQSHQANAYTKQDKETLEMLASQSAIALENARLFEEIQKMAMTDSLTNLFNRRKFFELADQEFERARRYRHPLSLIMMDIDLFKQVNDTCGHAAGDLVLKKIAEIYQNSTRAVDLFARYGGEEFVILMPETTAEEAKMTAERLRLLIANSPIQYGDKPINITISFGVVELDAGCKNTEELLDRSDQALYHSKNMGRNRVTVWSAELPPLSGPEPAASANFQI